MARKNGIESVHKKIGIEKNSFFYWILNYLLDCIVISFCLCGCLFGFISSIQVEQYGHFSVLGVIIISAVMRLLWDRRWKLKYLAPALYLFDVIIFIFYFKELYDGILYWSKSFITMINQYLNQNLVVHYSFSETTEYSSTVLLLVLAFILANLISQSQRVKRAEKIGLILPFCIFILPFVAGIIPQARYIIMFLVGSLPLMFQVEGKGIRIRAQVKLASIICFGMAAALILCIFPKSKYMKRSDEISQVKQNIQESLDEKQYDQLLYYGNWDMLPFISSESGGIGNGILGNQDEIKYDHKTDFTLYWPDYSKHMEMGDIYLKSYIGTNYKNKKWFDMTKSQKKSYETFTSQSNINYEKMPETLYDIFYDKFKQENLTYENMFYQYGIEKKRIFNSHSLFSYGSTDDFYLKNQLLNSKQVKGKRSYWDIMNVIFLRPPSLKNSIWNLDLLNIIDFIKEAESYNGTLKKKLDDFNSKETEYRNFVYDTYTKVNDDIALELQADLESQTQGLEEQKIDLEKGSLNDDFYQYELNSIIEACQKFLSNPNLLYSLKPGKTPDGKDFVDYFLYDNKKGYCTHFATAATIYLRLNGIPSRYVEGYYISRTEFSNKTPDIETKEGFSQKCYELDVTDDNAHAWTEIYINGYGWVPLDFTPSDNTDNQNEISSNNFNSQSETKNSSAKPTGTVPVITKRPAPSAAFDAGNQTIEKNSEIHNTVNVFHILKALFLFIICIGLIFLRFCVIRKKQKRKAYSVNSNVRVKYYYTRIMQMLYLLCHVKNQDPLSKNISYISSKLDGVPLKKLEMLIEVTDKASFGAGRVSDYECVKVQLFAEEVEELFYLQVPKWKKIYYKIWTFC